MTDRTATATAGLRCLKARPARAVTLGATLAASLTVTASARAGWQERLAAVRDDCAPGTRHAKAEYACEHARSRHQYHLNCAGLAAYAESERYRYNRSILSLYLRPGVTEAAGSGGRGLSSLLNPIPAPVPRAEPMLPRANAPEAPPAPAPTPPR
jgi:hypothetical protein